MDKFISKNADKLTFSQIMKMPIEERMRHLSPSQILKFQNKDQKNADMKFADDEEQAFYDRVNSKKSLDGRLQSPKQRGRNPQSLYSPSPRQTGARNGDKKPAHNF